MDIEKMKAALISGEIVTFTLENKKYFIQQENNKGWDYLGLWIEDGFPACIARAFFDVTDGVSEETVTELLNQPCFDGISLEVRLKSAENNNTIPSGTTTWQNAPASVT